jgi:thioredoxin reductase
MPPYAPDPKSIAGKPLPIEERTEILVIGAGPAGLACAMEAARIGRSVVLVDENPVPSTIMGDDVPLHFGGRASGAVRNRNAMMEALIASNPGIAAAFESGVDVRLATTCWGVYVPGPSVGWLPGQVAALMDESRSWMIGADRIVVAAGRRDMGLAFAGWELPGVMGATAALRLATSYRALDAQRAVVLGSTAESLQAALALGDAGVEVAAVVEQAAAPVGPPALVTRLQRGGVPFLCGRVLRRAEGRDGVEAAVAVAIDAAGCARLGSEQRIACDTIVLGIGAVPVIELLDAAGCQIRFDPDRGGAIPVLDGSGRTTVPGIFAAGDCAGIWDAKTLDPTIAEAEGRRCAAAGGSSSDEPSPVHAGFDLSAYRMAWVRASVIEAEGEPHVCRCEEVTAREILEVRPPRYLDWQGDCRNSRDLRSLLGDGATDPDLVKRLTRAGMGLCQGRRCREQVAALLAIGAGLDLSAIPPATHRAPVRPIPLVVAAATSEPPGMAEHWDTWFGMPSQYRPPWDVIQPYTVAARDPDEEVASE